MNYQAEVYQPRLIEGIKYQDFICIELHKRGIVLQNMQSKKYQLKKENLLGLEIKLDNRYAETGRLYIETDEKSDPNNHRYVSSGINRDDETWLYGIGDYKEFFIFSKRFLRGVDKHIEHYAESGVRRIQTDTSKGFLIPQNVASGYCERYFIFE